MSAHLPPVAGELLLEPAPEPAPEPPRCTDRPLPLAPPTRNRYTGLPRPRVLPSERQP